MNHVNEASSSQSVHFNAIGMSSTIWRKTMGAYDGTNAVWVKWMASSNPPARACGDVRPADDGYRVEIISTTALI